LPRHVDQNRRHPLGSRGTVFVIGDFVTTGNATINTIDATFDGIDCDDGSGVRLPFSGRIRVTK
jgi:hypothetical protein